VGTFAVTALVLLLWSATHAAIRALRRRTQLRGALPDDWWPAFEHEFRAYVRASRRSRGKGSVGSE
jgi:hypothetical protein